MTTAPTNPQAVTPYEQMGGAAFFADLVHGFYRGVATDPDLRPMYPEPDLAGAEDRLRMFLEQYWGGPKTYQERRGHPRLRLRHNPYVIDQAQHDRWLGHMADSLAVAAERHGLAPDLHDALWTYLVSAASAMINHP